ncbi:DnaB-like helicase N-terminal domain-containing protein [Nocardia sp. NPDC050697]|uniref:DnaB-like helicase N-terminal domain-containing protein n=1 Tax=Nocardia sp. NPDC050697 TaxID=3155158 RepID=UPI0034109639
MIDPLTSTAQIVDFVLEQTLLGWMLTVPEAAATDLPPELQDFHMGGHAAIYRAVRAVHARGEEVNPVTVCAELAATGELEATGGPGYMVSLTATYEAAMLR